jgi:hypothetical protein
VGLKTGISERFSIKQKTEIIQNKPPVVVLFVKLECLIKKAMNRIEKKFRNEKMTPPAVGIFKGLKTDPPNESEKIRPVFRLPNYDFIVEWQMNEKTTGTPQFT